MQTLSTLVMIFIPRPPAKATSAAEKMPTPRHAAQIGRTLMLVLLVLSVPLEEATKRRQLTAMPRGETAPHPKVAFRDASQETLKRGAIGTPHNSWRLARRSSSKDFA